ncbi:MAG: hypothetical protein PHQ57_02425 [Candidatus Omnitrophica bacterium]|nr:hypothetical protein [Candidatus Omnitrophota bacterium]
MNSDINQRAISYVVNLITGVLPGVEVSISKKDHLNYRFYISPHELEIGFSRATMDDFQSAIEKHQNTDQYRSLEGFIKFHVYVLLGQNGLIPQFIISKELLDEKRDWYSNISVSFERAEWFYKVLEIGLKDLANFLEDVMKKYGSQPEFETEHKHITNLLSFYNQHKSFTERGTSEVSLGYLKGAAVAVILKKEKERLKINIPRILHTKNKEIYDIVDELRKDYFLQTKMPDCVYDYAKNMESIGGSVDVEKVEEERNLYMSQNILCGPLAKGACDLLSSIENDFLDKNIFLDIPYQSNYKVCETTLRSVLSELGFNPIAAKDKLTSNAVLCKVCRIVKTCGFGIADISSGSNSIVYEYGLMHGLGMKVCLLLQKESEKFTDIVALEHLTYSGVRDLSIKLTRWLIDNISGVDLKKAKALIDRETQAIAESGDGELPRLQPSGAIDNGLKNKLLENNEASKKYNAEIVRRIKAEFSGKKLFFMTATPIPVGPEIIDIGDKTIQGVIKNPSSSRSRGWTMSFYDPAKDIVHTFDGIVKQLGELRLRLFRNGYIDFCAIVNDGFSWGMEDKSQEAILFNPYSITEYPVSFFRLLRELTGIVNGLNSFHVSMGFVNCGEYSLRPYGLNTYVHTFGMEENKRSFDDWYFEKNFQSLVKENDSDAFIFSERIYNTFGYSRDQIPYFNGERVFEAKE